MLTWFEVYLWTRLDSVQGLAVICAFLLLVGLFAYIPASIDYEWSALKKYFIAQVIAGLVFLFLAVAIPSSKDFALMYVLPKIANNEKVQQIPDKFLDLANKKLDEMLSDKKEAIK